jgi:colanic acid biosynthesis glycosyl transferase WcaI
VLPFQPLERVGESLAATDLHVVSIGNEVVGIVHPCKVYGALAVGRLLLFFGPDESHVGDLMRDAAIGWRVDDGNVEAAVATITSVATVVDSVARAIGRRAAEAVARGVSRETLRGAMCDTIEAAACCKRVRDTTA